MADFRRPEAEPEVQLSFSVLRFAAAVLLAAAVLNFSEVYRYIPDRVELHSREVAMRFEPVAFDDAAFGGLRPAGAWELRAADPRFGGLSALAMDGDRLLALSDSGVLFRFSKPGTRTAKVRIWELPAGPGDADFKMNRDSESLLRDPRGQGWWVGFENRNQVWLFDPAFTKAVARFRLGRTWPRTGFEALAAVDGGLLLFPERGGKVRLATTGGEDPRWLSLPAGPVSDAARLPDGSLLLIERALRPTGIRNQLVQVRRDGGGFVRLRSIPLKIGRADNLEGLAVEQRAGGRVRLWLITDDDQQWPLRTLLIALDWPPAEGSGSA